VRSDPIEFREKKAREMQELLEKLSCLDGTSFSSKSKERHFRTYHSHCVQAIPVFRAEGE
jgi:hypothetical protein